MAAAGSDDKTAIEELCKAVATSKAWDDFMEEGSFFIRPSGNPIFKPDWEAMMGSEDINMTVQELEKIEKIEICGDMAYATIIAHQVFTYKGTPNDDVSVQLLVCKKNASGVWKVVAASRSQGRPPSDPKPVFS